MDLTSIALFVMLVTSAIGVDTVLHPTSVLLDATVAGKIRKPSRDSATVNGMLAFEVTKIVATPSVLKAPEIRPDNVKGVGMALAEAVNMGSVAIALQTQFGYEPERIKLTMMSEDGATKLLVSGAGM